MKTVAVTGASGLIGTAVCSALGAAGYRVVPLRRVTGERPGGERPGGAQQSGWNAATGAIVLPEGARADVVIHLAGEPVAGLWSAAKKRAILASRADVTRRLAQYLSELERPPETLISASAIGIYGHRGDELLPEESMAGTGFLAGVCTRWEDAAAPARAAGIRVVHPRFGIVLARHGGALGASLPVFKAGLGAAFGNGRQWQSWISLHDTARSLLHILQQELHGPVNIVAPHAVSNAAFTRELGGALHRPAFLKIPAFALRAVLKDAADEMLLSSARVVPHALEKSGFHWHHPTLPEALEFEISRQ